MAALLPQWASLTHRHAGNHPRTPHTHTHTHKQTQTQADIHSSHHTSFFLALNLTGNPHMQMLTRNRPTITTWSVTLQPTFKLQFQNLSLLWVNRTREPGIAWMRVANFAWPIIARLAMRFVSILTCRTSVYLLINELHTVRDFFFFPKLNNSSHQ